MAVIMMHSPIAPGCLAATLAVAAFLLFHPQVSEADSKTLQQVVDCSEIVNDTARVECYDRIAKKLKANTQQVTSSAASPTNTEAPATNLQSDSLQTDNALGEKYLRKDDSHEPDRDSIMQLVHAYKSRQELWVFEFENGQAWQQIEARYLSVPKDLPAAVAISQGVMGSYDLRIGETGRTIKVKRLK